MVVKLLFGGTEISIPNAYIQYVENWNEINSKPMSHIEVRRQLAMALVGVMVKIVLHPPEDDIAHLTRNRD